MEPIGLLDTNVILRFVMQDVPEHIEPSVQFFEALQRGEFTVRLLDTVVFECVYALGTVYAMPRSEIARILTRILAEPGIILPGKERYSDVFAFWAKTKRLSFADTYHLFATKDLGLDQIISFDRGLRGLDGVTRVEPPLR
ncbi:MAG: PIN domain-containing protein [Thermomicrobiales bacterium]